MLIFVDDSMVNFYCLIIFRAMNSFLTMGWPLFFQGNQYYCSKENTDGSGECILKKACKSGESIDIQGRETLIKEFDLICEKTNKISYSNSLLFLSMVVSGFIFPILSDNKGRRIALLIAFFTSGISMFLAGFSNSFFFGKFVLLLQVSGFQELRL